jgi:4-hydroxy-tetrahydrodipicolinate synthase
MGKPIFTGSGVAIVTPFNQHGVDYNKLEELIEWHIQEGTDALIICGTTGEAPTLPIEEHKQILTFCAEKIKGRIPMIAGTGSNDTRHSISTSLYAQSVGADAILSVVPYYNKTTQEGLYTHFKTIADRLSIPVILYNVPARTGLNLLPTTTARLAEIPNIVAIKECCFSHFGKLMHLCPSDFHLYTGEDENIIPALSMGAKGVISVVANLVPKDIHEMTTSFLNGDTLKGRQMQIALVELIDALFCETSPSPVKTAMNMLGMEVGSCRLPLVEMEPENVLKLKKALLNYGLLTNA